MNKNIQPILLKIVLELKKLGWTPDRDWEITLQSENHIPLSKDISVDGPSGDQNFKSAITTNIVVWFDTRDEITFFPKYNVTASVLMPGVPTKDIRSDREMEVDVAFSAHDIKEDRKIKTTAVRLDNYVSDYVDTEYTEYVENNQNQIQAAMMGGKVDDDD